MTNLKQVAELAGVSASTVSRALNGKSYVNEATRQKVLEAVEKTNYRPNVLAKSLKMGRSNTICLMVPSIQNLIFPEIARGVEDVARRNGFTVAVSYTHLRPWRRRSLIIRRIAACSSMAVFCGCARRSEKTNASG